jgi:hypothetical protein
MEIIMLVLKFEIDTQKIAEIAQEYNISELCLFGSVLRDDFNSKSDIDILISFADKVEYSFFDLCELKEKFEELFKRKVDLIEKESLINPYRRSEILNTARRIYAT